MSLRMPSRQVCQSASNSLRYQIQSASRTCPPTTLPLSQRRNASAWDWFKRGKKKQTIDPTASIEEIMKDYKPPQQELPQQGKLADDSIFGPEEEITPESDSQKAAKSTLVPSDPRALGAALDPKPWARARWQRKKVIQAIQKRGRISRTEQILKIERHHLHGSDFFKTSLKKLMPIARQIAGKSIDDALVQLRFSKKLAARRVETELRIARDEAIVSKGMGLGNVKKEGDGEPSASAMVPVRQGKRTKLVDPTAMYIDQAWVNKAKYNASPEFRARGRVNMLKHPHTSISFLLKEEKTRLRIAKEKEEKKEKEKPWVQHPDRRITAQRQHIMW